MADPGALRLGGDVGVVLEGAGLDGAGLLGAGRVAGAEGREGVGAFALGRSIVDSCGRLVLGGFVFVSLRSGAVCTLGLVGAVVSLGRATAGLDPTLVW